jgi:hypothetical protein
VQFLEGHTIGNPVEGIVCLWKRVVEVAQPPVTLLHSLHSAEEKWIVDMWISDAVQRSGKALVPGLGNVGCNCRCGYLQFSLESQREAIMKRYLQLCTEAQPW